MIPYPVYAVGRDDFTRDSKPIGDAATQEEAVALLAKHFEGSHIIPGVELNDRDTRDGQIWAWWLKTK